MLVGITHGGAVATPLVAAYEASEELKDSEKVGKRKLE